MILHSFTMGDVEDPEIYAAQPIWEWQQTEQGQWAMQHCNDATFHIDTNFATMGYRIVITGTLSPEDETYFTLKYK
jgi:hypothetical protein